jgi:hypothetical protein
MKTRKKLREQLMDKTLIINGRWETYADHFCVLIDDHLLH